MALRLRRGTNAERGLITPADGELVYTSDTKLLYIGDGTTVGGNPVDTAGTAFGSNLDLNNFDLVGTGNINTTGNITVTGNITADGNLTLGGNLNIGDATTDTVAFTAKVESHIIPDVDGARNIGAGTSRFNQGWFKTMHVADDINAAVVNASIVGDDSTVLLNKATGALNASGKLTGDVDATDNSSFYNGTTKTVNAGNAVFSGSVQANTFTGSITGDVLGSIFGDDSSIIVDGINKTYTTANGSVIGATDDSGHTMLDARAAAGNLGGLTIYPGSIADSPLILATITATPSSVADVTSGLADMRRMTLETYKGSIAAPQQLILGDIIGGYAFSGQDSPGNDNRQISVILSQVDPNGTITANTVDQKIHILVASGADGADIKKFNFDSRGRMAINQEEADANLDVNGDAIVSGYTKFGNLTTVQRDALTPAAGMIIYNTTDSKFQGRTGVAWVDLH